MSTTTANSSSPDPTALKPDEAKQRSSAAISRRDRGQATAEYALVLLGAAMVGVLVIGWATAGGGAAAVGKLFDSVIKSVMGQL